MKNILFILVLTASPLSSFAYVCGEYDRSEWAHWEDTNNDCKDTRADVLIASSTAPVIFRDTKECVVDSGEWLDPYGNKTWVMASDLDIDHIVPLKWAHDHGGCEWTEEQKTIFANDYLNLLAVEDSLNSRKSSSGPNKWMPPNTAYHCDYLENWEQIVSYYYLQFTPEEQRYMDENLEICY